MAFEARFSRVQAVVMLVLVLPFFALGVSSLVGAIGVGEPVMLAGSAGLTLMFGGFALIFADRLRDRRPQLRIDASGIFWRRWSDLIIPWPAIERIVPVRQGHWLIAAVFLRDPGAYRSTTAARWLSMGANKNALGDIPLRRFNTDKSFAELLAAIERFAPSSMPLA